MARNVNSNLDSAVAEDYSNDKNLQSRHNLGRHVPSARDYHMSMFPLKLAPAGLKAMYAACQRIYPDQPNPLQVTSIVKYWFGGPDPLDYISMYRNDGDPKQNIPAHWHYISFGLSDLHGDGRVHKVSGPDQPSGHGFELTFRLKVSHDCSSEPPLWPASLLQSLARYIFGSGNTFCIGDHIPWKTGLDGSSSLLKNMIICADPQLEPMVTEFGTVNFFQVVGVVEDELKAVQWWNGIGVSSLMKTLPLSGGQWLITDMTRKESIFDINPSLREKLNEGILSDGSNLTGVSGRCCWKDAKTHLPSFAQAEFPANIWMSSGDDHKSLKSHDSVHITLDFQSAKLLPLAIRGRLKHGRHFTFKNVMNDSIVTLVAESVEGAFVSKEDPFVSKKNWLQVLLDDNFMEDVLDKCSDVNRLRFVDLPYMANWPSRGLLITVLNL